MGGIAGWITTSRRACDESALGPMLEAIAHRSPRSEDLCGLVDRNGRQQVVLGATLRDAVSGISIALDGAIANAQELREKLEKHGYSFKEKTNAEALLRAYQYWDKDAVKHLRGQFAFALWDSRKERLLLARDRFGEKPLFLRECDGVLYFASEIKALLEVPAAQPEVDMHAVRDCLVYGYVPGPGTLFSGIRKLAPGTCAAWQLGRLHELRYWVAPDRDPRDSRKKSPHRKEEEKDAFLVHLDDAVRLQREGGAGLFLSGGLDSTVLGALMARQNGGFKTFSLGFEGDPKSELQAAAQAAKHFGARHHEIVVSPRELLDALPRLVAQRDAPLARPSDLAMHRLATEAAGNVSAVLTGDGCDEVLGGYRRHLAERFTWGLRSFRGALGVVASLAGSPRLSSAVASLKLDDWRERYVRGVGTQSRAERDKLSVLKLNGSNGSSHGGGNGSSGGMNGSGTPPFDADPRSSSLRRILYFDQTGWLPDDLLERGDRLAMAASLELRSPYLDHRLAEYVSGQPDELRVRGLSTKWVLRETGRALLPPELRKRPKAGFRMPVADWLRGDLREPLEDHLRGADSITRKYYDAASLERTIDQHLERKQNHESLLWTLLNLEIWHRTYVHA